MKFVTTLRRMSEEEFKEEEHPREEDGKFASKDGRTEGALTVQSKDLDPNQKKRIENHFEKNEEAVKKSKYPDMLRELIDKYPSVMKNIARRRKGCNYDSKTHTFSDEDSEEQEMICGPSTTEIWLGHYGKQSLIMISNVYHGHVKGDAYDNHRQKKRYEAMGGGNYIGHVFMELDDGTIIDGSYGQIYPPEVKVTPDMRLRIISPDDPDYNDYVKTARDYPFANNGSGDTIELHKGNRFGKDLPRSLNSTPFTEKDDDIPPQINWKELNKLSKDLYKKRYLSLNGGQKKRIDKMFDKIEGWRKEAIKGMGKMGSSNSNKIKKLSESYGKFRSIEEFKEDEHPRDEDGKFADKDGSNARVERQKSILQQEIDYLKKYIKRESKIYRPFEKVSDKDRAIRYQNNSVGGQIEELEEELNSADTVGLPYIPLKPNTHKIETIDNGMYLANSDSEPKYESEREAIKSWSSMKLGLHPLEGFKKGNSTIKISLDIKEKNDYGIHKGVAEKQINIARIMWNSLSDEERDSISNLTIEKRPSVKYVKNEKGEDVLDPKSYHEATVVGSWAFNTNELTIRIDPSLKPEMIKGTFIHEVGHSMYHKLQEKHPERIKKWKEMVEKIPPTTKYGKYNLSNWKDSEKMVKKLDARNWEWKEVVARDSDGNPIRIGEWNEEVKMVKEPIPKEDVERLRGNAIKNIAFYKDLYFNEIHSEVHMYMMGQQKRGHMKKTGKATKGITKFIDAYRLLHDLPKMEEPLVIGEAEEDSPIMEVVDITESIEEVVIYLDEYFERVLNEDEGEYEFVIELNDDMTIKRYTINSMWEETATEEFREDEHPRENDGKFAKKGSGSSSGQSIIHKTTKDFLNKWLSNVSMQNTKIYDSLFSKGGLSTSTFKTKDKTEVTNRLGIGIKDKSSDKDWDEAEQIFLQALEDNPEFKEVFKEYEGEVNEQNKMLQKKFESSEAFYRGTSIDELDAIFGEYSDTYSNYKWSSRYPFKSLSMNYGETLSLYNAGMMIHYNADSVRNQVSATRVNYSAKPTKYLHASVDSLIEQNKIENTKSSNPAFMMDEEEVRVDNSNMGGVKVDKLDIFLGHGFATTVKQLADRFKITNYLPMWEEYDRMMHGSKSRQKRVLVNGKWKNERVKNNVYFKKIKGIGIGGKSYTKALVDRKTGKIYPNDRYKEDYAYPQPTDGKTLRQDIASNIQKELMENKLFRSKVGDVTVK